MRILTFLRYLQGVFNMNLSDSNKVHYAVIQSIYDEFIMGDEDLRQSRLEMCLSTATGAWLDAWGSYFNVSRKLGETDEAYSRRIIKSVLNPKCTIPALKDHIADYLQDQYPDKEYSKDDVIIKEPWKDVAKYSHYGSMSGNAVMSSNYYTHAVIDVRVPEEITKELIDLVNAVKAAGVKVLWSVYNAYEVVSGFNNAEDAWAAYHRHLQTMTKSNSASGLMLSGNGASRKLSGEKEIWFEVAIHHEWYAKVLMHNTDESMVISKRDLIGLIDYYTRKEVVTRPSEGKACAMSGRSALSVDAVLDGQAPVTEEVDRIIKVGEDVADMLGALDDFLTLSCTGRMSTSKGTLFEYNAAAELYDRLLEAVRKFREENPDYYESVQGMIENGERCMWYVARNKNWIWNTPLMSMEDFYEYWEPFGDPEHTAASIIGFEDAYYAGYITFGDKYQPPIVRGIPRMALVGALDFPYLFESQTLQQRDLEAVYAAKLERYGTGAGDDTRVSHILDYERDGSPKPFSVIENEQSPIEVDNQFAFEVRPHDCDDHPENW